MPAIRKASAKPPASQDLAAERIALMVVVIRGEKVMLDSDLAELYGVPVKVLNQAVQRNIERFPRDFMFQIATDEYESLRSQNVTLKRGQHRKLIGVPAAPRKEMGFHTISGPASTPKRAKSKS